MFFNTTFKTIVQLPCGISLPTYCLYHPKNKKEIGIHFTTSCAVNLAGKHILSLKFAQVWSDYL